MTSREKILLALVVIGLCVFGGLLYRNSTQEVTADIQTYTPDTTATTTTE
jgi:hypothetical protein